MDAWGVSGVWEGTPFISRTLVNRHKEMALSTNITRSAVVAASKDDLCPRAERLPSLR